MNCSLLGGDSLKTFVLTLWSLVTFSTLASAACPSLSGAYRGNWTKVDGSVYVTSTITLKQTGCEAVAYREFFGEGDVSTSTYRIGEVTYEASGGDSTNATLASYLGDHFVVTSFSFNTVTKKLNTLQNVSYRLSEDGSLIGEDVATRDLPSIKGQTKLTFLGNKLGN